MPHRAATTPAPEGHDTAPVRYRVGDLVLDLPARRVHRGGVELNLPPLSFDLLAVLVQRAPTPVPTRQLLDEVWPGLLVGPETVSQRIKLLRSVLGDDASQPRYVAGMRGKGYRIVAAVEPLGMDDTPPFVAQAGHEAQREARNDSPPRRFPGPWKMAAAASMLAFVLGVAAWTLKRTTSHQEGLGLAPAPSVRVAVSVPGNAGADSPDAFVAGLHEELIAALARQPGIDVIARPTMVAIARRAGSSSPQVIARDTGATHVVVSTVERDQRQVRLKVRLLDARAGAGLLERSFESAPENAAHLPAAGASAIAAAILDASGGLAIPVSPVTRSEEAFELYLRALHARAGAVMTFSTEEAIRAVEGPLARAVQLDPRFSAAQAELAMVRLGLLAMNLEPAEARISQARHDLELAYRDAPHEPKVLAAKAAFSQWIDGDLESAVQALNEAAAAGLADALWLQMAPDLLVATGRVGEAIEASRRILASDPHNTAVLVLHALRMAGLGDPASAIAALDIAIPGSPGLPVLKVLREQIHFWHTGEMASFLDLVGQWGYGAGFSQDTGVDPAEALRREADLLRLQGKFTELQRLLSRWQGPDVRSRHFGAGHEPLARLRGWANLLAGDRGGAVAEGNRILEFLARTTETRWNRENRGLLLAEAYLFRGDREQALATLHATGGRSGACVGGCAIDMRMARAAILAWSGDGDGAVRELESLATGQPSPGPALVAREPLFTIPLRGHGGFQELLGRLEDQMSEARRLLTRPQSRQSP